ncbi:MAG: glycosyltransferase [Colwellia sp.]|jgi:Glycosyltransferase
MKKNLLIIPSAPIWKVGDKFFFDRKFYDGIIFYCNTWNGGVQLILRLAECSPPEFGLVLFDEDIFPAKLTVVVGHELLTEMHIRNADIILASGDNYKNLGLSAIAKKSAIRCVYSIENILKTRFQIINMANVSYWQKLKSFVWVALNEFKRREAFKLSDGIQANGVPAYDAYNKLSENTLLYFDSRNSADAHITESELNARLLTLDNNAPLRLGFSGRLIAMKGVSHLIEMAMVLKNKKINFTLDIFGGGELAPFLGKKIKEYQLEELVTLRGNVNFSTELIPFVKTSLDLFVCCHRQSDPSCTYLETYACGVPIIGYANQAHQGILDRFDVGWSVAVDNVNELADKVVYLNRHREEIKRKAINAKKFSSEHTFEQTFSRCIEQCNVLAGE